MSYKSETQSKNLAWFLPRPKPDHYQGGMPLYCEDWLVELAQDILNNKDAKMLNVFCGMNKYGVRVDLNPEVKPDILADAHKVSQYFEPESFDIILADPPYSDEESQQLYNPRLEKPLPKLKYSVWTAECDKLLKPGGLFIVYHKYVMPNPNPEKYEVEKRVFVGNRTMHLLRAAIVFRKKADVVK
jgi:16S rRNA G966 N2-methylase RsmD